jgi:hypothetical protein
MGLALLSSVGLPGCGGERPAETDRVVPEIRFDEVRFRAYRGAVLSATGEAVSAIYRRDTGDLAAGTVRVVLPEGGGRPEVRISAPIGQGNARSRDFLAKGGVRLERSTDVAETEEARYEGEDGLVHGDRPVAVRGRGYALEGPTFVLDPRSGLMDIQGGARLDAGQGQGPSSA